MMKRTYPNIKLEKDYLYLETNKLRHITNSLGEDNKDCEDKVYIRIYNNGHAIDFESTTVKVVVNNKVVTLDKLNLSSEDSNDTSNPLDVFVLDD